MNVSHRERRLHTFTCVGLLMGSSLHTRVYMVQILTACPGYMGRQRPPCSQSISSLNTGSCHTFMHRLDNSIVCIN